MYGFQWFLSRGDQKFGAASPATTGTPWCSDGSSGGCAGVSRRSRRGQGGRELELTSADRLRLPADRIRGGGDQLLDLIDKVPPQVVESMLWEVGELLQGWSGEASIQARILAKTAALLDAAAKLPLVGIGSRP